MSQVNCKTLQIVQSICRFANVKELLKHFDNFMSFSLFIYFFKSRALMLKKRTEFLGKPGKALA